MGNRHERMPDITNHPSNASQNHNVLSPTPNRMTKIKLTEIASIGEDVKRRELLCTAGRNVNGYNHCEK